MRSCIALMAALVAALFLSACIQQPPGRASREDPQAFANQTSVRATFGPGGEITGFEWDDGKQKASIEVEADIKNGTFNYKATDVTQLVELSKIRAEAFAAFNASVTDVQKAALERTIGQDGIGGLIERMAVLMARQRGVLP